jgi:osmoprotectant transport system ATP-binding protein
MIEIDQISARYPGADSLVLDGVTLHVPSHRTLVLLGGSGTGKSTILRCILRLLDLQAGAIRIDGEDITAMDRIALRRSIGMVFQTIALFPHYTVAENIGLMLKLAGERPARIAARVEELLDMVGLPPGEYAQRYPHQLSGGQQQRVGVARALAPKPKYLLMDEPFGALDAITRRMLQEEVTALRKKLDLSIIFVTHDTMEAVMLADSVAVMHEGRVAQQGTIRELLAAPAAPIVQDLVVGPLREIEAFALGEHA